MADREENQVAVLDGTLTKALAQHYCPICLILEDKTRDFLCRLQFDAVRKEEVKESVISAGGYCHFHFWYLHKLASPVTNAELLDALLERIRVEMPDGHDVLKSTPSNLITEVRCPVCFISGEWEEELLIVFTSKIEEEEEFRIAYQDSRGLCLPHLAKVLQQLVDSEVRAFLVTATCRQLDVLVEELKLQVAKWRNKDRSPGEEQDSTYRAIQKLVSGRNYRTR